MTIETLYQTHPKHLYVKVYGQWTLKAMKQTIDEIKTEADSRGSTRLLLDMRELPRPDSEMTRFWSGDYLAKVLPPPFKVAAFANPEDINKFGENAAANRNAWFQIFSEEQPALRWLMDESERPPKKKPPFGTSSSQRSV
jgi:hypothetical protein